MERKWTTPFRAGGPRSLRDLDAVGNGMNALRGTPQRARSASISRLFATQAVVLRAMPRAKNEPSSRLR